MEHKKTRIYNYRLVSNTNFAPCVQDGRLSLACCKVDMRRVIGRRYMSGECSRNEPVWITAVHGSDSPYRGRFAYIAKVTDVVTYFDYFTKPEFRNREDCIYRIVHPELWNGENYEEVGWEYASGSKTCRTGNHGDRKLQERDWDWGKRKHSGEKYVLLSDEYRILLPDDTEKQEILLKAFEGEICKGVAHRLVSQEAAEIRNLPKLLECLIKEG